MMNRPLVTIVIPAYNHEDYIEFTIESVIKQDYKNIELIIINDGSIDSTDRVINKFSKKCRERFKKYLYINRENKGLTVTLNEALELSEGKYFSSIASDDLIDMRKISILVEELEKKGEDYAVASGNAKFIDKKGALITMKNKYGEFDNFIDFYSRNKRKKIRTVNYFGSYRSLLSGNYIPAMSVLIRTSSIKGVNSWEDRDIVEDWSLWLKLSKQYKFVYIDEPLAYYRIHGKNSIDNMKKQLTINTLNILKRERKNLKTLIHYITFYKAFTMQTLFIIYLNIKKNLVKKGKNDE